MYVHGDTTTTVLLLWALTFSAAPADTRATRAALTTQEVFMMILAIRAMPGRCTTVY